MMAVTYAHSASRFFLAALRMRPRGEVIAVAPSGLTGVSRYVPISETARLREPLTT
jgi:hypothetical protein